MGGWKNLVYMGGEDFVHEASFQRDELHDWEDSNTITQ